MSSDVAPNRKKSKKELAPPKFNQMDLSERIKTLYLNEPFYGYVLTNISRIVTEEVETACVIPEKGILMVNPRFFDTLTETQQLSILKHECLHLAFLHWERFEVVYQDHKPAKDMTMEEYFNHVTMTRLVNVACDGAINQLLPNLPEGTITLDSIRELIKNKDVKEKESAEYYYNVIMSNKDKLPKVTIIKCPMMNGDPQKGQGQQQPGQGCPQPGEEGEKKEGSGEGEGQTGEGQKQPGQGGGEGGEGEKQEGAGSGFTNTVEPKDCEDCPMKGKCEAESKTGNGIGGTIIGKNGKPVNMKDMDQQHKQGKMSNRTKQTFKRMLRKARKLQEQHERNQGTERGDRLTDHLPKYEGVVHKHIWEQLIDKSFGDEPIADRDWVYGRPSRRNDERFWYTKHQLHSKKVYVGLDTSASIGDNELDRFFGYIRKGMRKNDVEVTLVECDTEVTKITKLKHIPKSGLGAHGRGGTDLTKILDYVEKEEEKTIRNARLILLTDGYTDWRKSKVKTSVVYTKQHQKIKPVFNSAVLDISQTEDEDAPVQDVDGDDDSK